MYGGTKKELERLLADAEKLSGKKFDMSNFADITEAIHIVQTEMGITGTTALEASETIEGSLNATKSAFDNLLVGLSDGNADMDTLIGNLVSSAGNFFNNLIPVVMGTLNALPPLLEEMIPTIVNQIPVLITEFLPSVIESAGSIIESIVYGLNENKEQITEGTVQLITLMLNTIVEMLPELLTAGIEIVGELAIGLLEAMPTLVSKVPELIDGLVEEFTNNSDKYWQIAKDIVTALLNGIIENWHILGEWVGGAIKRLFHLNKDDVVDGSGGGADGSHAGGLSYVPYDGYTARLHKGERILTAEENKGFGAGTTIIQNIYAQKQSASDLAQNTIYQARKVALLGV